LPEREVDCIMGVPRSIGERGPMKRVLPLVLVIWLAAGCAAIDSHRCRVDEQPAILNLTEVEAP